MGSSLLEAALRYAAYGWPVLPVKPRGKTPLTKHGVKDASTDPQQIASWWAADPDANVAIATGDPSGVFIVDVDDPNAELPGELPPTARVRTGKGEHHLYQAPPGLGNTAGKLVKGVDTRGTGGIAVLPPSTHETGARYEWLDKRKPQPLPGWILEALTKPKDEVEAEGLEGSTAYGRAVLRQELGRLVTEASYEQHNRNDTLFQVAVRLFELAKAGQLPFEEVVTRLHKAAKPWEHDEDPFTEEEVEATITSAWDRAEAKPPSESDEGQAVVREATFGFLTLEQLEDLPPPEWLIPQVLPKGFTVLFGRRGGGKTFVALDIALTLADRGMTVAYCAGEGASGLRSRVDAWMLAHPGANPSGRFFSRVHGAFPRLVRPASVDHLMADMRQMADQGKPVDLIVIDTWRRALAGVSTSNDDVSTEAIDVLDKLRDTWGTSSLVVHHPKKPSKDDPDPAEAGSGALMDNADFAWKLIFYGHDTESERTMYNEKAKEWEIQSPLGFLLEESGDSLTISPSFRD